MATDDPHPPPLRCTLLPRGWRCELDAGHEGRCITTADEAPRPSDAIAAIRALRSDFEILRHELDELRDIVLALRDADDVSPTVPDLDTRARQWSYLANLRAEVRDAHGIYAPESGKHPTVGDRVIVTFPDNPACHDVFEVTEATADGRVVLVKHGRGE